MSFKRFDDFTESLFSYDGFLSGGTNSANIKFMKKLAGLAIKTELTGRQKECVHMFYIDEYSAQEIAEILNISRGTVYFHLRQAMKKLKRLSNYAELSKNSV